MSEYQNEIDAEVIIKKLDSNWSLLADIGATRLRYEMVVVGWLCRFLLWLVFLGAKNKRRQRALKFIRFFFPTRVVRNDLRAEVIKNSTGVVVYFYHRSLFDVMATVGWCLENCEDKKFLFPVNITLYEALAPLRKKLSSVGLEIRPLITLSAIDRIKNIKGVDVGYAERVKEKLFWHYLSLAGSFLLAGDLVALAPTATRSSVVFQTRQDFLASNDKLLSKSTPRSMRGLMLSIKLALRNIEKVDVIDILFVPFVATRLGFRTRKLNFFLRHDVWVGEGRSYQQMLDLNQQGIVDVTVLHDLAEFLPEEAHYPPPAVASAEC